MLQICRQVSSAASSALQGPQMSGFSTARLKMVDGQVRTNDVTDRRILDAMLTVPREAFVPASRQALAYLDLDLDVSEGGAKRFLIKPQLIGKLLQAAEIGEGDNVLVVGCATGYLAALTAKLARQVTATESDPALAAKAKDAFAAIGVSNVTCKAAACAEGDPAAAPYDVIILNGATEVTPDGLFGQLREGGRLVGVSAESRPSRAMIVTRTHGEFGHRPLFDAAAPVLPGLERAAAFVF
ncbi:protein-L-isoaspartate O-methyltransferase [Bradyrhizobium rifense]|uniref:Protein-L-isoaspartate O-methyltransferase n=2 Tax=Bradyrhizobium rifense TaxID=515499 RepID=A0A5D3KQ19_9BRAD|nr:protein-L-isoaspartate O-methyltransferase [Bradyrhizobium rifense]